MAHAEAWVARGRAVTRVAPLLLASSLASSTRLLIIFILVKVWVILISLISTLASGLQLLISGVELLVDLMAGHVDGRHVPPDRGRTAARRRISEDVDSTSDHAYERGCFARYQPHGSTENAI